MYLTSSCSILPPKIILKHYLTHACMYLKAAIHKTYIQLLQVRVFKKYIFCIFSYVTKVITVLSPLPTAYPVSTPNSPPNQVMRPALSGTDVNLPCYIGVSALRNYDVCWYFTRVKSSDRNPFRCTSSSDYSLTLPNVTSSNNGTYQCEVSARRVPQLPVNPGLEKHQGPNIKLAVFGK